MHEPKVLFKPDSMIRIRLPINLKLSHSCSIRLHELNQRRSSDKSQMDIKGKTKYNRVLPSVKLAKTVC